MSTKTDEILMGRRRYGEENYHVVNSACWNRRAWLSTDLATGIASAAPGLEPKEIAMRACMIADYLLQEFDDRGWAVPVIEAMRPEEEG